MQADAQRIPNPLKSEKSILSFLKNKNELLCKQFFFSDSIILIANDDSYDSFLKLIIHSWRILQMFISFGMPLRGAISYGDIYINEKINLFLGESLTKAYDLELQQQWIGVIIDKSAVEKYNDIFNDDLLNEVCLEYDVPLKNGLKKRYKTLNWRFNMIVKDGTRSLFPINENTPDDVKEKINNTLDYAHAVILRKKTYLYGDDVPIEFRSVFVGNTEPPFAHGDDL